MTITARCAALALFALAGPCWAQSFPTLDAAREAARANRNTEAANLLGDAIEQQPARRAELLREYADQLTYSQRAARAVPLYEEVLRTPRSEAGRVQALKGYGLALLWSDQPGRARPVFEDVLRIEPENADASRNLGRALSWGGRQREAVAHLERHLHRHPGDDEARVQLAQAQAWMGRADNAAASLRGLDSDDAHRLSESLASDVAPRTVLQTQRSSQSDQLDIRSWRLGQTVSVAQGRGTLGLRFDRTDYRRQDGTDGAQVIRPMATGRWRFLDALEWNAELGRERVAPVAARARDFTAYSTWMTFWPNDLLRFDLSSSRADFDNLQSLRLGLTHQDDGLSVDFTPTEQQRYTARWQQSEVSDGNARRSGELEAEYRFRTHPQAWFAIKHTRFDFDKQLNNGYFNPLHFESTLLTVRARWHPSEEMARWDMEARASFGRENADPGGSKNAYDVEVRSRYTLASGTWLVAHARRFSSRTASATGFARGTLGLAVERRW